VNMLSRQAQLNVEMDHTAKAYWTHLMIHSKAAHRVQQFPIFGEEWQIWDRDQKLSNPSSKELYEIMQDSHTHMWWVREGYVRGDIHGQIDYDATKDAMRSLPEARRRYVTKTASFNCGVGTTLVTWKHQLTAECPRCSHKQETTLHVQQCQGYGADEVFQKGIMRLDNYLVAEDTSEDLRTAIVECIQRWRKQEPIRLRDFPLEIREVIGQQHQVGWLAFTECLPVKGWRRLHQQHLQQEGLRRSSRRWIRGLLRQLHYINHNQWKHVKSKFTSLSLKKGNILRCCTNSSNKRLPKGRRDWQREIDIFYNTTFSTY
jgi:hypothetical protein